VDRILVIDDDVELCSLVSEYLKGEGFQVDAVYEGNRGLERAVGLSHVEVIHCNDSVTGLGSNRDRHANIGDGQIGEEGFRALLHEPRLAHLPFILEVPGGADGPDAEQVAVLKRLAV